MVGGAALVLLGFLHEIFGLPALQRAIGRGELAPRLAAAQMVNQVFSGMAMSLLGVLAILAAWELDSDSRLPRRLIILTGVFFALVGVAAYAWHPRPAVLIFAVVGLMLCVPIVTGLRGPTRR